MKAELLQEYCSLVNETFQFIEENFENIIPAGRVDPGIFLWTKDIHKKAERLMSEGKNREMETLIENYLKYSKEYFKNGTPGYILKSDRRTCCNTILNVVQLVANLSILLDETGYKQAGEVISMFRLERTEGIHTVKSGYEIPVKGYRVVG